VGSDQVDPRLRSAVDESLAWYDALCALHGARCGIEDDTWVAYDRPPPLHSAAKTVEPTTQPDRALTALDRFGQGSIADSFGRLDLTGAGLEVLFEARWIHREPPESPSRRLPDGWSVVRTPALLASWTVLHDTTDVLIDGLLDRSGFRVLARQVDGRLVGGFVTHLCGGVVSVSNAWSDPAYPLDWSAMVVAAAALHPGRALVGYEQGDDLRGALEAGFRDVGPQVVWVR